MEDTQTLTIERIFIKCWQCNSHVEPHPKAELHPIPECSFVCTNPKCDQSDPKDGLLSCSICNDTSGDWWWRLEEIWEDWYICKEHNMSYCQNCYFNSKCWKHNDEFCSDDDGPVDSSENESMNSIE